MPIPRLSTSAAGPAGDGQLALELGHAASHAEADFMVWDGNRLALAHIRAFPGWPGPLTLLMGPPKSGKSHLARIWAERSGAVMPDSTALEALARGEDMTPLVIEDVDRSGYDEGSLFHLLNQSMRAQRPLLMTARTPIANWPYATEDVRSRARLAALLTVSPAGDTELSQMFVKLFGDRQLTVDPRIIGYVVPRMERSPEEVVALVEVMDRLALARGTAITRSVAAEALAQRGEDLYRGEAEDDDHE